MEDGELFAQPRYVEWAVRIKRSWGFDVLVCPRCSHKMTVLATITDPEVVRKILDPLHVRSTPLPRASAQDRVLLEDTGTGATELAGSITEVIQEWLSAHGKTSIPLVVTHSHGHGDHVGGDSQFQGLPNTEVVGTSVSAVQSFFGIRTWPTQFVQYDLGGRVLDIIPIPGHHPAHIALYDRELDILLTGDTLYPGRLYINDWQAYKASIRRMTDFVDAGNPVTWVLGTHIEMDVTGADYPMQAPLHPNEHALELTYPVLAELHEAVFQMGDVPSYQAHQDFIIYP
jgi:hydroxyacylglutathione hydrolase